MSRWIQRSGIKTIAFIFFLATIAAWRACPAAVKENLVEQSLNIWDTRRREVSTLIYRLEGTAVRPAGFMQDVDGSFIPDVPHEYEVRIVWYLDFVAGKARREYQGEVLHQDRKLKRYVPKQFSETACWDGSVFQLYTPHDQNDNPGAGTIELRESGVIDRPFLTFRDLPVVIAGGTAPLVNWIKPNALRPDQRAGQLMLEETVQFNGRECALMRTPPLDTRGSWYHTLWVDVDRDAAILRVDRSNGDHLHRSLEIQYEERDPGWMPTSWVSSTYEFSEAPEVVSLKATDIRVNPDLSDVEFHIEAESGQVIVDARQGNEKRVKGAPGQLDLPIGEHLLQQQAESSNRFYFSIALVVMAVLLAVIWAIRRKRSV